MGAEQFDRRISGNSPLKMRKERNLADARRVVFITLFIDSFNLNCPFDDKRGKVGMDVVPKVPKIEVPNLNAHIHMRITSVKF